MNWTKTKLVAVGLLSVTVINPVMAQSQTGSNAERLVVAKAYLKASTQSMNLEKLALISAAPILKQVRAKQPKLFAQKGAKLRAIIKASMLQSMQTAMDGLDQKLATTFTLQELNAMNEFYSSEIGRRVLSKMPQYLAAIQPAMQKAIIQGLPKMLSALKKEGVKLR